MNRLILMNFCSILKVYFAILCLQIENAWNVHKETFLSHLRKKTSVCLFLSISTKNPCGNKPKEAEIELWTDILTPLVMQIRKVLVFGWGSRKWIFSLHTQSLVGWSTSITLFVTQSNSIPSLSTDSTYQEGNNNSRVGANTMDEIITLIKQDLPEGRQSLKDSFLNLERVAEYCEDSYYRWVGWHFAVVFRFSRSTSHS